MAASMIRAYNPYVNNSRYSDFSAQDTAKSNGNSVAVADSREVKKTGDTNLLSDFKTEELITNEEREFFKKMFPDSAGNIAEHVLFTRNGGTKNIQVNKGVLLDSRI